MKKLLSLLSVLTISGTAVPTTIAVSPYEKEKNINSDINYLQTNNLDTLNRNKRENNINLNVPNIVQADPDWCGPAIGESLLRYFNYNANNSNTGRGSRNFQSTLAYSMRTNPQTNIGSGTLVGIPLGTSVESWQYTINQIITTNNLNQGRQYSIQNIDRYCGNTHITNTIRNSLQNNMPVALAYRGVLPGSFSLHSNNTSNHFILINGISYNNQTINYMDPWTGQFGTFDINSFWLLVSRDDSSGNHLQSYLIYHDPNSQSENQIPNSNQTEPMEIGNCGGVIRQAIIENNLHCILGTRSKRDYLNNNLSCPSAANPYYEYYGNNNEKNDYFRVWGKSGHDGIELKISLKTALAFENFFQQNQSLEIKNYLENLIKHVEQKNDTWSGGWILDTDIELMKNFIYDGYLKFHDKLLELIDAENRKKKNNSIFVRTWRTYNWANLSEEYQNSAFYISKNSKGNNY
ncbi:C39 family peptidase [Spiroplasma endosymbiont of Sarcophaga variegata]|uniref:C39 family peptidase n=1 Tax=Spiroplasma endosymbiont of Sarcophaga variegata TaxID=3066304 RepID=UPI003AF76088